MHKVSAPEAAVTLLMKRFPFSSSGHRRLKSFPATDAESSREEVLSPACRAAEQFIMGLTGLATPPPLVSSLEPPLYKLIVSFILAPRPSSPSLHSRRPSPPAPTPQRHHHDQCFFFCNLSLFIRTLCGPNCCFKGEASLPGLAWDSELSSLREGRHVGCTNFWQMMRIQLFWFPTYSSPIRATRFFSSFFFFNPDNDH